MTADLQRPGVQLRNASVSEEAAGCNAGLASGPLRGSGSDMLLEKSRAAMFKLA